jgi:hypothetical protein
MRTFYTLEITLQRTDVEQKATVYFPISAGLGIYQIPVTQLSRTYTYGISHFVPPGMRQKNYGLTVLVSTIWRDTLVMYSMPCSSFPTLTLTLYCAHICLTTPTNSSGIPNFTSITSLRHQE